MSWSAAWRTCHEAQPHYWRCLQQPRCAARCKAAFNTAPERPCVSRRPLVWHSTHSAPLAALNARDGEVDEKEHVAEEGEQEGVQLVLDGLDDERGGLPNQSNSDNERDANSLIAQGWHLSGPFPRASRMRLARTNAALWIAVLQTSLRTFAICTGQQGWTVRRNKQDWGTSPGLPEWREVRSLRTRARYCTSAATHARARRAGRGVLQYVALRTSGPWHACLPTVPTDDCKHVLASAMPSKSNPRVVYKPVRSTLQLDAKRRTRSL